MVTALVAIGSNLGDRRANLAHALAGLKRLPRTSVSGLSAIYETAPVGGPENQGPFLNAAASLETALPAAELLASLHDIECNCGRERVIRWAARTLDLDLLTHGETVSDDAALILPHPRMHERRFVMVPVCDLQPALQHARLGLSMAELLALLPVEPGDLAPLRINWTDLVAEPVPEPLETAG
jgi:2-amino-4-hydroxy-6-hydroxymethyldihydropteridine diphosphokinase